MNSWMRRLFRIRRAQEVLGLFNQVIHRSKNETFLNMQNPTFWQKVKDMKIYILTGGEKYTKPYILTGVEI